MYDKKKLGNFGEDLACRYLEKYDYNVLERNFSCRQGEIDIIAYDMKKREIAFIEVKTRTSFNYGFPSEAVNKYKRIHILNSIKYYLYLKNLENVFVRIDVIEIVLNRDKYKLNHLKGVM